MIGCPVCPDRPVTSTNVGSNCFQCPACNELVFVIKNPYLAFDQKKNYPLPNLWVSELQRLGLETDNFMGSTGTYAWAFLVVDAEHDWLFMHTRFNLIACMANNRYPEYRFGFQALA